ncbi:MAG: orotate phosphoribosyltransferase [Pseudomonadota bacterium]|nr:orotate phosphoribosyltransferase [Pseudomonadota bacterium]
MPHNRQEFIRFAIEGNALRFGQFTLKSGRISPYFFNAGEFNTGAALARLGRFYADALMASDLEFDMVFGPAYKGIPLVSATAVALADRHQRNVPWCFNRKEIKDHGEGGQLVGAPLQGRVVIIDDVMTAGTAVRESIDIIQAAGADPVGVVVCLDRQERGPNQLSAVQEVQQNLGLGVISIANLDDILSHLRQTADNSGMLASVEDYRRKYGA